MKLDILGIQGFVAIADGGGFQKAADSLGISQTALTRRLQNLEADLGVTLIERTTRSLALTAVGRDFLPQAQRLLSEMAATLAEIREHGKARRGDITVACVPTLGVRYLPAVLRDYATRFPENRVRVLDDRLSPGVTDAVLRREAEIGINVAEVLHPDLTSVPLLKDRFVLICRDDHPLAGRRQVSWRDLAPHPLIAPGRASANRTLLDLTAAGHGLPLHPAYEVQRSSTAVGLVAEGVAAAIVPRLALSSMTLSPIAGAPMTGAPMTGAPIRVLDLIEPTVTRTIVVISRARAALSPAARALYDLILAQARRAPAPD